MTQIKRCDSALKQYKRFYEEFGYLPKLFNPYNYTEITDIAPTLTAQCTRINASSTVLVLEEENSEKESDNLTDYPIRITVDGFHQYRNDYKKSSIQGTHVTFEHGKSHALSTGHIPKVLLTDVNLKGSDNLTKILKYYDADEQEDITQTEAEEWATEIALRIKEGNLDPIPKIKDEQFEQYDFNYVSLFSGIGGFETALNKLGGTCVFASEIDKFAAQAYETLYGHKPHGDVTKIDAKDVPDHDLLVGGFPCQAFSVAGKRKGFEDTRGTLFFEVARIAREKQPKALLLENVKGLVGHDKGRTLDTIVKTLNDIGYTVDFEVLNSKYFGVPQNRERIFIVAVRDDLVEVEPWFIEGTTVVPKGKRRISGYEGIKTFNFDWPAQEEVTTRLRDILESEVDEKYYLDEEKTTKLVAQLNEKDEVMPAHFPTPDDVNNTIRTGGKGSLTAKHNYEHIAEPQMVAKNPDERMSRQAVETYNASELSKEHGDIIHAFRREHLKDGICPTLSTRPEGFKTAPLPIVEVRPVLTPNRIEKRQNGRRFKEDGEESFTLTSQDRHGVALGKADAQGSPKYRIRKLTPRECFRLQNFPDEAFNKLKDAGISDSQLYRQAGNAVTTSVIEALGERLIPIITEVNPKDEK